MKKIFIYTVVVFVIFSSCKKEDLRNKEQAVLTSEGQTLAVQGSAANTVTYKYSEKIPITWYAENPCTGEWVVFSGTIHYRVGWVENGNRLTFHLHYNMSDVKGVGLSTGTQYISTQSFNYTNNVSYVNQQILYQQRETLKFIAKGSQDDLLLQNDWHLTINANGVVTFYFSTNGPVISCL